MSRNFPCVRCNKFVCQLGQARCELCEYGHSAKHCPHRINVSTYASTEYIHGPCKGEPVSNPDPNAWQCGDCGEAPIPSDLDWCPKCAEEHETSEAELRAKSANNAKLIQVGGEHYIKYAIQPWDIIDCYGMSFYEGSALKYLLRYRDKNGIEDLKKARHYIDKLIEVGLDEGELPNGSAD